MSKIRKARGGGRIAANGYKLCEPLPSGHILQDCSKKKWVLGKPIGLGGFGEIYLCRPEDDKKKKEEYVMKLDNIQGPLFVEMYFYMKVANQDDINKWKKSHKLSFLGVPHYVASGTHTNNKNSYRFLVIPKFGDDFQKRLDSKKVNVTLACDVAIQMLDVLEYIHSYGYIHADIKATNILQSLNSNSHYYLLDYGLAEKYKNTNDVHKEEKFDKKRANNGTIEFRSRDAHLGQISRRSDIECLAFNLILWLSGSLPWMNNLNNPDEVYNKKINLMTNENELKKCFKNKKIKYLQEFIKLVSNLSFDMEPNYLKLKELLNKVSKELKTNKNDEEDKNGAEDGVKEKEDDEAEESPPPTKRTRRTRKKV